MRRILTDMLVAAIFALPVFIYKIFNPSGADTPWMLILTLLLISPVAEEMFFRGVLLELTLRQNIRQLLGNIAVSVVFAAVHVLVRQEPAAAAVFFPSVILGWLYCRHRRVIPVIVIHSFYNIVVLI